MKRSRRRDLLAAVAQTAVAEPSNGLVCRIEKHIANESLGLRLTFALALEVIEHVALLPGYGVRRFSRSSAERRDGLFTRYAESAVPLLPSLLRLVTHHCYLLHYSDPSVRDRFGEVKP